MSFSWKNLLVIGQLFNRAAEWNPSVFRPEGKEEIGTVIERYLKLAIHYDYPFNITKYCLQQLLGSEQDSDHGRAFLACATLGNYKVTLIEDTADVQATWQHGAVWARSGRRGNKS